jgi:hypothetical protein
MGREIVRENRSGIKREFQSEKDVEVTSTHGERVENAKICFTSQII